VFFVIKTFRGLSLLDKLEQLKNLLKSFSSAVVAYSGGVDSTFLTVIAHQVLGEKSLAVTAVSPTYPEDQLIEAKEIAVYYGMDYLASWNYKHIVKVKTKRMVSSIAIREGYRDLEIITPMEVLENED
jgi:PP-loop superfamily ATP-utilizing enzyme